MPSCIASGTRFSTRTSMSETGTLFSSRQPFAQSARVKYDDIAQRYGDALYAGKYDPAARPVAATPAPASASGAAANAQ